MGKSTVCRFAVVGTDGRRSSEWRVWTGSRKPTDDVYVAPRSAAGSQKVSIHKDGYAQHGPERTLREELPPDQREAFDRWGQPPDVAPGWRIAYVIAFHDSHLLPARTPLGSNVTAVSVPEAGEGLAVLVAISDDRDITDLRRAGVQVVAHLSRKSGGAVAVCAQPGAVGRPAFDTAQRALLQAGRGRYFPRPLGGDERYAWAYSDVRPNVPMVIEFAVPDEVRANRFSGVLKEWRELPDHVTPPAAVEVCAVLYVPRATSPELYVNQEREGCTHQTLERSANHTLNALINGFIDDGWDRTADGGFVTALVSRQAADRLGLAAFEEPAG